MKNLFVIIVIIALICTFTGIISAETDPEVTQEILTVARAEPSQDTSIADEPEGELVTANVQTSDSNNFTLIIVLSVLTVMTGVYMLITAVKMIRRSSRNE
ncbi:MAG: hypothetical protein ACYCYI_11815 [Saccharofermentanales bacterium]